MPQRSDDVTDEVTDEVTDGPLTPRSGRVRQARRLTSRKQRRLQGRFLAEGPHAVREALHAGAVLEVFGTAEAAERHGDLRALAAEGGARWTQAGDDVVAAVADTVTPQGVVAVCRVPVVGLEEVLTPTARLVVIGAEVGDAGNAGTLLRCADAAGADGAVLAAGVDPYNPKAVRASAGSLFHLPVATGVHPHSAVAAARSAGLQVLAADGSASTDLDGAERRGLLARRTAWLLGNEAHGLPDDLRGLADERVAVPLYGRAESLNLATAAAVCLYASARVQRLVVDRAAD